MTPEQRRAHLVLHGQTLLDAWQERCRLVNKGRRLRQEGTNLWDKGSRLAADGFENGNPMREEGYEYIREGDRHIQNAEILWQKAVEDEFGDTPMLWYNGSCTLGVGEHYEP